MFQCLLANDGPGSYVIFNYADGLSPLINESIPLPVQAGINAGFGPTPNFVSIPNTSNISVTSNQCWGRYFEKVTSYILLVTFRNSNSLHITDYFQEKVTRYSYILL